MEGKNRYYKVYSIFKSIDGEVNWYAQGGTTFFIRLVGCNLRCNYCDTKYAFEGGRDMKLDEIIDSVTSWGTKRVTITGGEPLLQDIRELVEALFYHSIEISVETNGSVPINEFLRYYVTSFVVDYKLPCSGYYGQKAHMENFPILSHNDFVKFVIADRVDFDIAVDFAKHLREKIGCRAKMAYSPVHGSLDASELYEWMMFDGVDGILNVQLHKLLNLKESQ